MNDFIASICYGIFFASTGFSLRRAKYGWLAAVLAGLVSPVAFIVFYALLGLPLNLLAGKLHIPENVLPQNVLSFVIAVIVVAGWVGGGFLLTRRKQPPKSGTAAQTPGVSN